VIRKHKRCFTNSDCTYPPNAPSPVNKRQLPNAINNTAQNLSHLHSNNDVSGKSSRSSEETVNMAPPADRCMVPYIPHPYIRVVQLKVVDTPLRSYATSSSSSAPPQDVDIKQSTPNPKRKSSKVGGKRKSSSANRRRAENVSLHNLTGRDSGAVRNDKKIWQEPERTVLFLGDPREIWEAGWYIRSWNIFRNIENVTFNLFFFFFFFFFFQ
jgi:hypothetical protein